MRKVFVVLWIIAIISSISFSLHATAVTYPDIPVSKMDKDQKVIVIVTAAGDIESAVEEVTTLFPHSEIRKTFTRVLNGFSIEVMEKEVEMLKTLNQIERVDQVINYEANLDDSVPFIGGDNVKRKCSIEMENV